MKSRKIILPILALLPLTTGAVEATSVREILSSRELLVRGAGPCPAQGARFRIDSRTGDGPLAYTEAVQITCDIASDAGAPWTARLRLIAQESGGNGSGGFIRVGDPAVAEKQQGGGFPGRNDLLLTGRGRSAKHKPLTYLGLIGETAETLDSGEVLIDVATRVFFGATDRLSVSTVSLATLAYPNLSFKYKIWSHPWSTMSLGSSLVGTGYGAAEGLHLYSAGLSLYYDVKSNTKMISHTVITVATPPEVFRKATHAGDVLGSLTSSIRTGQQYIFDNWDRLLYGPQYMFETRSVGGYLGYVFVWDTFHLSVNLNVYDLTKLKFGVDGYVPHVFGFWRF